MAERNRWKRAIVDLTDGLVGCRNDDLSLGAERFREPTHVNRMMASPDPIEQCNSHQVTRPAGFCGTSSFRFFRRAVQGGLGLGLPQHQREDEDQAEAQPLVLQRVVEDRRACDNSEVTDER